MNWNTNVISTSVSGSMKPLPGDLTSQRGKTVTLAFATGECGSENWGGVPGAAERRRARRVWRGGGQNSGARIC